MSDEVRNEQIGMEMPEDFGSEDITRISSLEISADVTNQDIFKLAKRILLFCAIIFIIVAFLRSYFDEKNKGVAEVWDYSKVILNSITSLVLGLYFGKKDK
ncbi:MAG: hypothetical protein NVS1B13_14270 [Flavisolibacter sp.]